MRFRLTLPCAAGGGRGRTALALLYTIASTNERVSSAIRAASEICRRTAGYGVWRDTDSPAANDVIGSALRRSLRRRSSGDAVRRARVPGEPFHYSSADTPILVRAMHAATRKLLSTNFWNGSVSQRARRRTPPRSGQLTLGTTCRLIGCNGESRDHSWQEEAKDGSGTYRGSKSKAKASCEPQLCLAELLPVRPGFVSRRSGWRPSSIRRAARPDAAARRYRRSGRWSG